MAAVSQAVEREIPIEGGVGADAEGFGTRPRTDRPHSINLFGPERSSRDARERALHLLVGVGIGAAAMYYLDPGAGARRRAAIRGQIVDVVTKVAVRRDALGAAADLLGAAFLGLASQKPAEPAARELRDALEGSRLLE